MGNSWPSNCREIRYHLARAIMHLNYIAGFLPFFQPAINWDDPDVQRRFPPTSIPITHNTHPGRSLHTFVPLPSVPSQTTMFTHGGLPTHMILNPEPKLRPIPNQPSEPSAPSTLVRSRSIRGNPQILYTTLQVAHHLWGLIRTLHQHRWNPHQIRKLAPRRNNVSMLRSHRHVMKSYRPTAL
jgi:hypothetical protein